MKGPLKCLELAMMFVLNKLTCVAHNIVHVLSVNPLCSPSHFLFFFSLSETDRTFSELKVKVKCQLIRVCKIRTSWPGKPGDSCSLTYRNSSPNNDSSEQIILTDSVNWTKQSLVDNDSFTNRALLINMQKKARMVIMVFSDKHILFRKKKIII